MIFKLQDELTQDDFQNIKDFSRFSWVVYNYYLGSYEGSGFLAGWVPDECRVYYYDLSHCSCYGPCQNEPEKLTLVDFFARPKNAYDQEYDESVRMKVAELVGMAGELQKIQAEVAERKRKEAEAVAEYQRIKSIITPRYNEVNAYYKYYFPNYNLSSNAKHQINIPLKLPEDKNRVGLGFTRNIQVDLSPDKTDQEFKSHWDAIKDRIKQLIDPDGKYQPPPYVRPMCSG